MLSRVAEAIYWMSRNVERAANVARFVDVTLTLGLDFKMQSNDQWQSLISTTGDADLFRAHYGEATQEHVVRFLTTDANYANSILSCLRNARENARSIRETISTEMWEHLNRLYYRVRDATSNSAHLTSPLEFFRQIKHDSHLFDGLVEGTLSRNRGWHFAQLGRMLERADKTSRILDVKYFLLLPNAQDVGTPTDDLQWSAVLRSVGGFEMFRKRHRGITPGRVVGFLVLDRLFPRAIMYCVNEADRSLHAVSGSPLGTFWNPAEKRLGKIRNHLAFLEVDEILEIGLHEFIDDLQSRLNRAGVAVQEEFFDLRYRSDHQSQMQR